MAWPSYKSPVIRAGTALATAVNVAYSPSPIAVRPDRQFDRPLQDEWGIFDPQQAGLEALLRRLQSCASDADTTHEPPPAAKSLAPGGAVPLL